MQGAAVSNELISGDLDDFWIEEFKDYDIFNSDLDSPDKPGASSTPGPKLSSGLALMQYCRHACIFKLACNCEVWPSAIWWTPFSLLDAIILSMRLLQLLFGMLRVLP